VIERFPGFLRVRDRIQDGSVNDEYFSMIELIDQFTIDERERAYRVASRLSNLLKIPMKLKEGPFDNTPRTISAAGFPKRA
jgi:hypothetical protein